MTRLIPIAITLVLASCATISNPSPDTYDRIQAEVNDAEWYIRDSIPELKYLGCDDFPRTRSLETRKIKSLNGQLFTLVILNCCEMSIPGDQLILTYLKNPDGKIVHWKSCWLSNRLGSLGVKMLDVNGDGVKEFCFVSETQAGREQILSAYAIRDSRFDPVIAEHISSFDVQCIETNLPGGLLVKPLLEGRHIWETGKLYEIPIRICNQSVTAKDLNGCSLKLSPPDFCGYFSYRFETNTLPPGASMDATVRVRFLYRPGSGDNAKFGVVIEDNKGSP